MTKYLQKIISDPRFPLNLGINSTVYELYKLIRHLELHTVIHQGSFHLSDLRQLSELFLQTCMTVFYHPLKCVPFNYGNTSLIFSHYSDFLRVSNQSICGG